MNKKTIKIAGWALGLSMAVAGIGASVTLPNKSPLRVDAATSSGSVTVTLGSSSGQWNARSSATSSTDANGQTWTVSYTTSPTANSGSNANGYNQFGSSSNGLTALSFVSSGLTKKMNLTAFSCKYGGSGSGAAGQGTLKIGSTTLKAGEAFSGANDKTVSWTGSTTLAAGSTLNIDFSGFTKGTKVYFISYTLADIPTYSVSYSANGGTGSMSDASSPYESGSTVTVKANEFTAPSGKIFANWNTKSGGDGTSYNPKDTFAITGNTTLYAQWDDVPSTPYVSVDSSATVYTGQTPSLTFSYGNFTEALNVTSGNESVITIGDIDDDNPLSSTVSLNISGIGNSTITFLHGEESLATCVVTVAQTAISGLSSTATVRTGEDLNLGSGVTANVGSLIWTSSAPAKATVNSSTGVVRGVSAGETVITATSSVDSKVSVSCTVTVLRGTLTAEDAITRSDLDFGGETKSYQDFTVKTSGRASQAEYAGCAYVGDGTTPTSFIQLRTTDSNSGLITTKSGGKRAKSIRVVFDSSTSDNRIVDVYGTNTAYTGADASALYGDSKGTKAKSFTKTSSDKDFSYNFENDYKYIGVRSNSGALYLASITITWEQYYADEVAAEIKTLAGGWSNTVSTPNCNSNYKAAKEMILTLSSDELNVFKTSLDAEIASARTTYEWWCNVNSDDSPWSGTIKAAAAGVVAFSVPTQDSNLPLFILTGTALGVVAVGGAVLYGRRRRENQ